MKKTICLFALLLVLLSVHAQTHKQLRDSLSDIVEALSFYPDSIDLRLQKAGLNIELEQWQYAKEEYDRILSVAPDNISALFYRAYVYTKQSRYNFARADYEHLLALVPAHFEASLGLALLNYDDNHFTEAFDGINKMAELFPDSSVVYAVRAGMEQGKKMFELAENDYSKAIELSPSNTDYRLSRANLRLLMRRKEDARADLDALVEMGIPRVGLQEYYERCK